jgi:Fe-Mn family superoxide dismutase
MTHELPALSYPYEALEPYIDAQTMQIHHDKHHATYVNNLNAALEKAPELQGKSAHELIQILDLVPESVRAAIRNNAGGHLNHTLFWENMTPGGSAAPSGDLAIAIDAAFGSFAEFKLQFQNAGLGRFGSGWVWLVKATDGTLKIVSTPNQDSPLMDGLSPLLGNDVWEHAYYLQYQNLRAKYLEAWWNVVNWDKVEQHFNA